MGLPLPEQLPGLPERAFRAGWRRPTGLGGREDLSRAPTQNKNNFYSACNGDDFASSAFSRTKGATDLK